MPGSSRAALVTGAAGGIGAATVHRLCAQGYGVVAVDARRESLYRLASAYPDQVVPQVVDVRDVDALGSSAALALERFGRLDAAVAAAAVILGGQPLWETPAAGARTLWDVDVFGVWNTASVCVPAMLRGPDPGGCRFVAVASAAAAHGLFHLAAYTTAKHAVVGLVRGLAADLAGTGVTAVAVSPGSTRTDMLTATADLYGLDDVESFATSQLVGRLIEPDEVAAAITFCCSVDGGVVNGSVVAADGGFRP